MWLNCATLYMYSARDLCIVLSQRLVLMLIYIDFRLLALFLSLSLSCLSFPLVDLNFFRTLGCYIDCLMPVSCLVSFVSATSAAVLFSSRLVWCWCASVYIYNQKSHSFCIQGRSQLEIKVYRLSNGWHIVFLVRLFIYTFYRNFLKHDWNSISL